MTERRFWGEKRYFSLDYYLKTTYGEKLYKVSLNGGCTCPNRDGTCGERGCIFCSEGGSGDFAASPALTIREQLEEGKALIRRKQTGNGYIAYFQAYTNTYAPLEHLRKIFYEAILEPDVRILSVATRPDCLSDEILALLDELNRIKPVWVELGLQSIHPQTAAYIRRGYPLSVYDAAVLNLHERGIEVITHVILGLPGETADDMLATADYIAHQPIQGVKFQLLHVLKGTDLYTDYLQQPFHVLTLEEYTDILIRCIEHMPPDVIIHRITGDGPKHLLAAPDWSRNKKQVLNHIHHCMKLRNAWQGRCYVPLTNAYYDRN